MTVEEFIRARLAEDEDIAAGAIRGPRRPGWSEDYGQEFMVVVGVRDGVPDCVVRSTDESRHIARHDPARVLRQTPVLRAVVELIEGMVSATQQSGAEDAVLYPLAEIWSEHPDYRDEWRPTGYRG